MESKDINVFAQGEAKPPEVESRPVPHQADYPEGFFDQRAINGYIISSGQLADRPDGTTHVKAYFAEDTSKFYIYNEDDSAWAEIPNLGTEYTKRIVNLVLLDDNTNTTVGDGVGDVTLTIPSEMNGWNLIRAQAAVEVAGTTGTTTIQIYNVTQAADMLSTKITIDSAELTSYTAATPPVIDASNDDVATGDKLRVDCDAICTTPAKGLQVILTFQLPA